MAASHAIFPLTAIAVSDDGPGRALNRITQLLAPASLSLVVAGLLFGILEAAFPRLVPRLPLSLQEFLPPAVGVLAQSSKSRTVPREYTALFGDSYAQGEGDWHLASDGGSNLPYHTGHLLYQAGMGDVLSFGVSGSGSLEAIVGAPLGFLTYLDTLRRFDPMGAPKTALIYFYEGNDLNDNLRDIRTRFFPRFDSTRLFDEPYFQRFIATVVVGESPLAAEARGMKWRDRLLLPGFVRGFLAAVLRRAGFRGRGKGRPARRNAPAAAPAGRAVNRATVAAKVTELPERLQGPALELTDEEFRQSVWALRQATVFMRQRFPATDFVIVYVPSPLSCYAMAGDSVTAQSYEGRGQVFPAVLVRDNSDRIAGALRQVAESGSMRFIDARPELRAAAAEHFIHGPADWKHFNRSGYEALTRAIVSGMARER